MVEDMALMPKETFKKYFKSTEYISDTWVYDSENLLGGWNKSINLKH